MNESISPIWLQMALALAMLQRDYQRASLTTARSALWQTPCHARQHEVTKPAHMLDQYDSARDDA
jgi:hypothetical protein